MSDPRGFWISLRGHNNDWGHSRFPGCMWVLWCRDKNFHQLSSSPLCFLSLSSNIASFFERKLGRDYLDTERPLVPVMQQRGFLGEHRRSILNTGGWLAKSTSPPVKSTLIFHWAAPHASASDNQYYETEGGGRGEWRLETNTATASPAGCRWKHSWWINISRPFIRTGTVRDCDDEDREYNPDEELDGRDLIWQVNEGFWVKIKWDLGKKWRKK